MKFTAASLKADKISELSRSFLNQRRDITQKFQISLKTLKSERERERRDYIMGWGRNQAMVARPADKLRCNEAGIIR